MPMTPECWRRVEELYHTALEREPLEGAALMAHADPDVRREVESLLAQRTGDGLLNQPAWNLPSSCCPTTWPTLPLAAVFSAKRRPHPP